MVTNLPTVVYAFEKAHDDHCLKGQSSNHLHLWLLAFAGRLAVDSPVRDRSRRASQTSYFEPSFLWPRVKEYPGLPADRHDDLGMEFILSWDLLARSLRL